MFSWRVWRFGAAWLRPVLLLRRAVRGLPAPVDPYDLPGMAVTG